MIEEVLIKEQPTTYVRHFRYSNFKHKMQRLQMPQKLVREKFYVHEKILHEIAAVELSKLYFLKNAKKSCKPNNRETRLFRKVLKIIFFILMQRI